MGFVFIVVRILFIGASSRAAVVIGFSFWNVTAPSAMFSVLTRPSNPAEAAAFLALCEEKDQTPSKVIKRLMQNYLDQNGKKEVVAFPRKDKK